MTVAATTPRSLSSSSEVTKATGSQPTSPRTIWFDASRFEDVDFDASGYVTEMRRVVPLERLREELQRHLGQLRNDLVDVINEDYAEFIGLSAQLGNVEGSVTGLRAPLFKLKDSLVTVQERYRSELQSLRDCLKCQSEILTAKALLELAQDASSVMGKVEALARELPVNGTVDTLQQASGVSQLLERIAGEMSRLKFYMTQGQDLPIVAGLQVRLQAVLKQLEAATRSILTLTLQSDSEDDDAASTRCLHASTLVGDLEFSVAAVRQHLINPALSAALRTTQDAGQLPGTGGEGILFFLETAKVTLEPVLKRLVTMCNHHPDLAEAFNPLGSCVLPELQAWISHHMPDVFSPGVPLAFHANYTSCMSFLGWLEGHAGSAAAVRSFRGCEAYSKFMKAWNLAVYFSLQFQEIAGSFDQSLQTAPSPSTAGTFQYTQSDNLCASLLRCQSKDIRIPALADRFLKLQIQLLLRYGSWLREADKAKLHPPNGSASANGGVGSDTMSMKDWVANAQPDALVLVIAETDNVVAHVRTELIPVITSQLSSTSASFDLKSAVDLAFNDALTTISEGCQPFQKQVVSKMVDGAMTWLRHVKSIAATYRMTARAAPTKASHYVANLLKPAMALKASPALKAVSDTCRTTLLTSIADSVLVAFHQAAAELLDTVARTQASLSRLGRGRGPQGPSAASADGDMSDKMQMQLRLDVVEYGRQMEILLDTPACDVQAFQQLLQLVPEPGAAPVATSAAVPVESTAPGL